VFIKAMDKLVLVVKFRLVFVLSYIIEGSRNEVANAVATCQNCMNQLVLYSMMREKER